MKRYNEYGFPTIPLNDDVWIEIVPGGPKRTYIWVGDPRSGKGHGAFIGTSRGTKSLRRFAKALLEELGDDDD